MTGKLDESFLQTLEIPEGSVVVDCGASIGDTVEVFLGKGAIVHAFEPNPAAFAHLQTRFPDSANLTLYQKAISDHNGTARFFLHEDLGPETLKTANGSSLLDFKGNVDRSAPVEVPTIDLSEFLLDLETQVEVLKIDIEGAELGVVNKLLDTTAYQKANRILVETHERKIPELLEETNALRERIESMGLTSLINLEWH